MSRHPALGDSEFGSGALGARRRRLRPLLLGACALAAVLLAGWAGFSASVRQGTEALRAESNHQLDLFASVLQGMVRQLEYVPATLQLQPEVLALLQQPEDAARVQAAGSYLRRLNAHLRSASVFVLDPRGRVLASSLAAMQGEDQSFRPFFQEALAGRVGRHFAIGVPGSAFAGVPGYFVSHPIHDGARVVGVAVVQISLEPVNEAWSLLGAPALLADSNQVVVLSSRPEWRYTALTDPALERRGDLQQTRLYGDQRITRFPLQVDLRVDEDKQIVEAVLPEGLARSSAAAGAGRASATRGVLVLGRTLDGMDWRLLMFSDLRVVRQDAVLNSVLAAVSTGFLLLLALLVQQRQRIVRQKLMANRELEEKVALRTQALSEANRRLRKEVRDREKAERTLRNAQDELVHAGKMAALGQLATGITHELTQPLGAIRTLSANAVEFMRRGEQEVVAGNLGMMARLADQMGAIIEPLKGFARKSQARPSRCDVAAALGNALFLYDQRLRKEQVAVLNRTQRGEVFAWCDPNRLEQVLINLIGNALDAMHDAPERRLQLSVSRVAPVGEHPARLRLDVHDSGAGLSEAVRARLFEPFFSTKEAGAGLGLGLAISRDIAREAGGELEADNHPDGGACFHLWLPPAPDPSS